MPRSNRLAQSATRVLLLAATLFATLSGGAQASTSQLAMFQDDGQLLNDPAGTLQRLRTLGVDQVRLFVRWQAIAPRSSSRRRPRGFHAANPDAYPAKNWAIWDTVVQDAQQNGIKLNFDLFGGAPQWATGRGAPKDKLYGNWEPSPGEFGAFVRAVATRYSGSFTPAGASSALPRVSFWSIWNEPDYGPSLAPQGVPGNLTVENSPRMYRDLVDAAWSALHRTGHGHDTILFGEVAPRGLPTWGVFSGMKPLIFLRAMYCLDSHYHQLRGHSAALRGCPTNQAGSSRFPTAHPALFEASGFADHPYMRWYSPNREIGPDPDFSSLGEMHSFERALDRLPRAYGSGKRFPIYDTEFGYITSPPKHTNKYPWVSQSTAAYYLSWAEYIQWRDPRIRSVDQYLLHDPVPALASNDYGGFASGLLTFSNHLKPAYFAYRLPLFLPVTTARAGHRLEVWGSARPAHFALTDVPADTETVQIQFQPRGGGAWTTLQAVNITDPHGYFDTHLVFPRSGTVRLTWTYPSDDAMLIPGYQIYSRHVQVKIH